MNPAKALEITIVGAGVIGLSCAWSLSRSGVGVEVLEAPSRRPAAEASLGVLAHPSPLAQGAFVELHRRSLDSFPSFIRMLEDETGRQSDYQTCGVLEHLTGEYQYIQAAREVKQALAAKWRIQGQPALELLSAEEARTLEPHFATPPFGALLHRAAARVNARRILTMLRLACRNRGVRFQTKAIAGIVTGGGRVQSLDAGGTMLPRRNVIVCAGAWSSQLNPDLESVCPIRPIRGQSVLVEVDREICQRIVRRGELYVVPQSRGRVLLGATTERDSGFDARVTAEGLRAVLDQAAQSSPVLAKATFIRANAGLRPAGPNGRPRIGPVPGVQGLFIAAGHYKTGLALAPITAEIMSDCVHHALPSPQWAPVLPGERQEAEDNQDG